MTVLRLRHAQQAGFSLLEVLVAISILLLGVAGPIALATESLKQSLPARIKLEGTLLAQEGMELVRNIRDNNVHKIYAGQAIAWDEGFCPGGAYPCDREISCAAFACNPVRYVNLSFNQRLLKIPPANFGIGFHTYDNSFIPAGGDPKLGDTLIIRKIHFEKIPPVDPNLVGTFEQVKVVVTVVTPYVPIELVGYLTNWR